MATLQKFKFLARQCAVANSPIRKSPTSSPVVHLRRRKILRMLLGNGRSSSSNGRSYSRRFLRRDESATTTDHHRNQSDDNRTSSTEEKTKDKHLQQQHQKITVRYKLKDLFVSSSPSPPPSYPCIGNSNARKVYEKEDAVKQPLLLPAATSIEGRSGELVVTPRRNSGGQLRPLSATVRQRLLRRVWRPVLMAIPEQLSPECPE